MSAEHWLSENLQKRFNIPDDARAWLLSLWNAIQVFDDMADGDFPDRENLDKAICDTLVLMPANPFFQRHQVALAPLLSVAILKWKASDDAERAGKATETTFVWRAGYYDIVLAVIEIVHGRQVAMDSAQYVAELYGENFSDYQKEFSDA